MCPKSRCNIGSCLWNTQKGRKRVRKWKIWKCPLFLSDWIISWCHWKGLNFSRNHFVSMETRAFIFLSEKNTIFHSDKKPPWKTYLFSFDVNFLGKIVIKLFLLMGLLCAVFPKQYGTILLTQSYSILNCSSVTA